jgi:two-component system, chemotaxis family, protein-glutamate methylesterase/glutaminase
MRKGNNMNILIVDDSALLRGILREFLEKEKDLTIVGEATNGEKAIAATRALNPDLIIMDVNMPVMDGIEATRQIMKQNPTPVLVFSAETDAERGFEAMEKGAIEILRKPPIDRLNDPAFHNMFVELIRTVAGKKKAISRKRSVDEPERHKPRRRAFSLLVIGASTGGPVVVRDILKALPSDFPLPVAIVQHLEMGFEGGYVEWLNENSAISVVLAKDEGTFASGTAVVAPADYHLRCTPKGYTLDKGEKVLNQRPSVDILFSSAADVYTDEVLGVLLTGMGRDGANGCVAIKANGGYTICQDETSAAIFGMPKAAIELKGASEVLSSEAIIRFLHDVSGNK